MSTFVRLLLLDDDSTEADRVRSILASDDIIADIKWVNSRETFETALDPGSFEIILAELYLESFDGLTALAIARARNPDIPIIFVSGTFGEDVAIGALKSGATDYVLKARLELLPAAVRRAIREVAERRERREAQEALQSQDELLRAIIDTANDGFIRMDANGLITEWNAQAEKIFGWPRSEAIGRRLSETAIPPQHREAQQRGLKRFLETGKSIIFNKRIELQAMHRDGHEFPIELTVWPVHVGDQFHFCAFAHDVTDRRNLEQQLRQAQKMEAIGKLAGGVAHDFNNLLTIINGRSQLMMTRMQADDPMRKELELIYKTGERAAQLTRQLLAFSRRTMMQPRIVDLNVIVGDLEKMLRRLLGEDIDLAVILDPKLSMVKADPSQLEQVIMNLAVNARDAMPQGGKLTIETSNRKLGADYARVHTYVTPGRYVMLSVSDNGCGMDESVMAHLFEPFFTTKELGKGTGLGLSTVYGIVKQSNGHIEVYSEINKGTTFKVYLPETSEPATRASSKNVPVIAGNETILLVEDEQGVRELVRDLLEMYGYKVLVCDNGNEALEVCAEYNDTIHLLMTDVVMPEISGPELAKRLHAMRPAMKVLYMSGYTDHAITRHGLISPDHAFIQKPFSPHGVAGKVRSVLDGNK